MYHLSCGMACLLAGLLVHPESAVGINCEYDVGVDHPYGDIGSYVPKVNGTVRCCALCSADPKCVSWTLETDTALCFKKSTISAAPCSSVPTGTPCTRQMANRISMKACAGPDCPPPPPPSPPPPPPPHHWLPVHQLSQKYRNWSYWTGGRYGGFAVPPLAGNFTGQTLTDTAVVFEKTPEDTLPGRYRLTYLFFNGTKGANGYEVGLATSDDLLNWDFNHGGDNGIVFKRNAVPGTYDYGGVTFGGMLWSNASIDGKRTLKKVDGKYWALYGCYPSRSGYEAGDGGQGMALSEDGVAWERVSATVPVTEGGAAQKTKWNSRVVYQPFLVESNGTYYDFYNAAGINEFGQPAEETGFSTLPVSAGLPGIEPTVAHSSKWAQNPASPVLPSGAAGSIDTRMASDPKVFWDEAQQVWVCMYVALGTATHGHATIGVAFSTDLVRWDKDDTPLYNAGGHPGGLDSDHAHKISIIYDDNGVGYLYYTAVGVKGRGIALLTSKPMM